MCVVVLVCVGAADLINLIAPKGVFNGGARDSSCICTAGSQNKHINKREWEV